LNPESALVAAILRTLIYADVFNFPMTAAEIHHFLIDESATLPEVETALSASRWLNTQIDCAEGYYVLRGRAQIIAERQRRDGFSETLWPVAVRYGAVLARLPFVRMVALTGALAVRNAHGVDDDLDYLIVTKAGRVWLARALSVVLVRWVQVRRGVTICPNYVLSESALAQDSHDLYMAHEIAQMIPISGLAVYQELRAANAWTADRLPNAHAPFYTEPEAQGRGLIKSIIEGVFGGFVGDALEDWERRRKLRKFAGEAQKPHNSAQLDAEHVKGHFNDYGYPTLNKYHARLIEYGLQPEAAMQERTS
jgi:GNAT superfamily N-acetyltransferase